MDTEIVAAATERLVIEMAKKVQTLDDESLELFIQLEGYVIFVRALERSMVVDALAESSSALGFIAFRNEKYAVPISNAGAIPALLSLCNPEEDHSVVSAATGTLFLLCFHPDLKVEFHKSGATEALSALLKRVTDLKILTWVVGILATLTSDSSETSTELVQYGILKTLLKLCQVRENESCLTYAVGLLHNVCQVAKIQRDAVSCGAVDILMDLCHPIHDTAVIALAMRTIRSLSVNEKLRDELVKTDIIPRLIRFCLSSCQKEILTEAMLSLASLSTTKTDMHTLGEAGMFRACRRVSNLLGRDAPPWLTKLNAELTKSMSIWRFKSARMLLLGNPGSRSSVGEPKLNEEFGMGKNMIQLESAAMSLLKVANFFDEARLYKGALRTGAVDTSLNFTRKQIRDEKNADRFQYGPPVPLSNPPTLKDVESHLISYFKSVENDDTIDLAFVWFSGRGHRENGGWLFRGGALEPGHLFDLWDSRIEKKERENSKQSKSGTMLYIVADSCHSSSWIRIARERKLRDVIVQSSCNEGEESLKGPFLKAWLGVQMNSEPVDYALDELHHVGMHPDSYLPWETWADEEPCVSGMILRQLQTAPLQSTSTDPTNVNSNISKFKYTKALSDINDMKFRPAIRTFSGLTSHRDKLKPPVLSDRFCGDWHLKTSTNKTKFYKFTGLPNEMFDYLRSNRMSRRIWILGLQIELITLYGDNRKVDDSQSFLSPIAFTNVMTAGKTFTSSTYNSYQSVSRASWDVDALVIHHKIVQNGLQVWLRMSVADDGNTLIEQQTATNMRGQSCSNDCIYSRNKVERN
eukprot:g5059.t1